jgi:SAM-dependent methyltransferase
MPIQIDRKRAENLAPQFDEALELVRNEFEGLDPHRQYRNAFARLLKPDPLGRVLMMGTDQRDMFAPELRRAIETSVPSDGHILDFGAGDGQTFALVADALPPGTRVSIEEPNPEYLANYLAFLKTKAHLRLGMALAASFDEIDAAAERSGEKLPSDGSIDLSLALHMLYFVSDLPASVTRMVRFLKPGGVLFVVVTDETVGYTGLALKSFIEHGGDTGDNARHLSVIAERRRFRTARGGRRRDCRSAWCRGNSGGNRRAAPAEPTLRTQSRRPDRALLDCTPRQRRRPRKVRGRRRTAASQPRSRGPAHRRRRSP